MVLVFYTGNSDAPLSNFLGNVYGENSLAGHVETYGEASWARFRDEPPSAWYYLRWAGMAVPVFPSAYVVFDTTP